MATVTKRGIIHNTTAGTHVVASFTPTANALLVAFGNWSGVDTSPTLSDSQGGTWTQIQIGSYSTSVAGQMALWVRTAGVSASAMTVTQSDPGADTGGGLAILEVTDVTVYGASAVRQSQKQVDQAAGTPAPVLGAAANPANVMVGAVVTNTNGSANCAVPSGWDTEDYDQGYNTPPVGVQVCHRTSGETNTTITFGAATPSQFGSIVAEIIVNQTITPGLIDSTGATFTPEVQQTTNDQEVTPALINQTAATFAPELVRRVITEFGIVGVQVTEIGERVIGPTTETGRYVTAYNFGAAAQTVSPGLIDQTGVTFSPQVAQTVAIGLIDQTGVMFGPQVNQQVAPGLISSLGTTFDPTVSQAGGAQTVSPGLIDRTGATFAPQANQQITPGLISSVGSTFAPQANLQVAPGLISSVGATFTPTFTQAGAQTVTPGLITQTGSTFSPQVNRQIVVGLISSVGSTFAPTAKQQVQVPITTNIGTVFVPTIAQVQTVNPGLITSTGAPFALLVTFGDVGAPVSYAESVDTVGVASGRDTHSQALATDTTTVGVAT